MYKTATKSLKERSELIKNAVSASQQTVPFYEYQNKRSDLRVIRLEIGTPIYRMENFRTRTAQLKFVQDQKKPQDFFSAGQENESAQQAQHDLLIMFAKQGKASSVSPIYEELQGEEQRLPLIISSAGVVIDGNRRLSAMRELFAERPSEFKHFSHVDCAVLPSSVTQDEVREIEVRLQMRPETKLPYAWVNESLAIQELLGSGRKPEYVADLMKKKKKTVERAAQALTEADIYLKDWLRAPGAYQHVEDAEQFFSDLARALEGKQGDVVEVSRRIAWTLVSSNKLKRRVYDYNFSFDNRTDEVVSALFERLDIEAAQTSLAADSGDSDDDLDIDIGEESDSPIESLIELFDDPKKRETVAEELLAICDSILERDKDEEVGKAALNAIKAANSKLQEVDLSKAEPKTRAPIKSQLESIIKRAEKLKAALESAEATKS